MKTIKILIHKFVENNNLERSALILTSKIDQTAQEIIEIVEGSAQDLEDNGVSLGVVQRFIQFRIKSIMKVYGIYQELQGFASMDDPKKFQNQFEKFLIDNIENFDLNKQSK